MYTPNFGNEARSLVTTTVSQAKGRFIRRPEVRGIILYMLCTILVFGGLAFLGHAIIINELLPSTANVVLWTYAILLGIVFLLGMLHVVVMRGSLSWIRRDDYMLGSIFTIGVAIVGGLTMFFMGSWGRLFESLAAQEFKANVRPLTSTIMAFPLPYFIRWAFELYEQIPPKIYKLWRYNPLIRLPNLTERDRNNTKVVTFVLDVKFGEPNPYDMRSKIPDVMLVGDGFKLTLDEDNRKHPNRQIEIANARAEFYEWYFYMRRAWWKPMKFIDPYKTVEENHLRDGDRIIATRRQPARRVAPSALGNPGQPNGGGAYGGGYTGR
ncbi:TssN family type VI secretion system protein [Fibrella sp. WM1]|uniref:TssN family type VI secretion system protein n=1 Tax=Fibrella musci TaxID=3242485 RepID=UPI00352179DC